MWLFLLRRGGVLLISILAYLLEYQLQDVGPLLKQCYSVGAPWLAICSQWQENETQLGYYTHMVCVRNKSVQPEVFWKTLEISVQTWIIWALFFLMFLQKTKCWRAWKTWYNNFYSIWNREKDIFLWVLTTRHIATIIYSEHTFVCLWDDTFVFLENVTWYFCFSQKTYVTWYFCLSKKHMWHDTFVFST